MEHTGNLNWSFGEILNCLTFLIFGVCLFVSFVLGFGEADFKESASLFPWVKKSLKKAVDFGPWMVYPL